jgi:hypothetical protein
LRYGKTSNSVIVIVDVTAAEPAVSSHRNIGSVQETYFGLDSN